MTTEYIEYTITVKDESNTLSRKEISYEPILLSKDEPRLFDEVRDLLEKFKENQGSQELGEAPEIVLKFKMVWQS